MASVLSDVDQQDHCCIYCAVPQSRITWRHDSVLYAIFRAIFTVVKRLKRTHAEGKLKGKQGARSAPQAIRFKSATSMVNGTVSKGADSVFTAPRAPETPAILPQASDWRLKFDLDAPAFGQTKAPHFPVEITMTGDIPDGVIWSASTKTVVWIELTSPWEENMTTWHDQKKSNYNQLKIDCEAQGWTVHALYVEVGCRGHVREQPFDYVFRVLGFTKSERRQLKKTVEETALVCSYLIWVHRYKIHWEERSLLDVSR